jgi:hypothetical protein
MPAKCHVTKILARNRWREDPGRTPWSSNRRGLSAWIYPDVLRADSRLGELIQELRRIGADGQTIAELSASQQYLKAPRAERAFIEELLIKPLRRLEHAPSPNVRSIAIEYSDWLVKIFDSARSRSK